MRRLATPAVMLAVAALAACAGDAVGPDADGLTADEVAAVGDALDDVSAAAVDSYFGGLAFDADPAADVSVAAEFTVTRDCPLGGTVTLAGTAMGTWDREMHSASRQVEATRTEDGCTVRTRGDATLTLDGAPNTAITLSQRMVDGVRQPRVLTQVGAFDWTRSTGESGTCEIDLVSTLDHATHTLTIEGRICNRAVSVTRTRTRDG